MIKIINAVLAVLAGVGGMLVLYWLLNLAVDRLPMRWEQRLKPYVFVGPAVAIVGLFLVYPAVKTIQLSFANANTTAYVGLDNYVGLFSSASFREALVNNLLWIIIVPALSVVVGLLVAVLADRLGSKSESITKSVIFLPMAISFVGASAIWGFIYDANTVAGEGQIGVLNAVTTTLGFDPVIWLQLSRFNFNDFLLMVIMIWLQAGFAMVLMSAAIKNVPEETIEAARIDGASEFRIYWQIALPLSLPALATLGVFHYMYNWNDLLWPLIITTTTEMRTLPAGLTLFMGSHVIEHAVLMAGATISLIPLAVAFLVAQRYFVRGVVMSGLK